MYVYALAQWLGLRPGPDDMEKGGGGEGKGKKQAVVLVDMPVIAPKGRRRGIATAPLGGALTPPRQWDRGRDIASASPAADR